MNVNEGSYHRTAQTRVSHSGSMAHLFDLVMMNDHIRVYLSSEKCVSSINVHLLVYIFQVYSTRRSIFEDTDIEDTLD